MLDCLPDEHPVKGISVPSQKRKMMKGRSDLNGEREQFTAMSGCSVHQPFDGLALQEKFPERLLQAHFPERDSADRDLNGGILQDSPRGPAQPLRGIDQPEESTGVEEQRQVPRNCDSLISQSSAIAICALPANNPSGRLVPLLGTGETIATAFFLRPKVTVIDSPLRTVSKASEKRLLNSPTLIVFTTAY